MMPVSFLRKLTSAACGLFGAEEAAAGAEGDDDPDDPNSPSNRPIEFSSTGYFPPIVPARPSVNMLANGLTFGGAAAFAAATDVAYCIIWSPKLKLGMVYP